MVAEYGKTSGALIICCKHNNTEFGLVSERGSNSTKVPLNRHCVATSKII